MAITPRVSLPYPEEDSDPWFDLFTSMMNAIDTEIYASREDRNTVLAGGGTLTFSSTTGVLTWSADITIFSPITGYLWTIPAGNVTLPDGSLFYVTVVRGPSSSVIVTPIVASQVPTDIQGDAQLLIGWRKGSLVHFRDGHCINNLDSNPIFDQPTGEAGVGTPGGSNGQVQYKSGGTFLGAANVTYDGTNLILLTALKFQNGANFGTLQMTPTGARTLTLPDATDTLTGRVTTDTLQNKTLSLSLNTLIDASAVLGDLIKFNGTKYTRLPKGSAYQVPIVAFDGSDTIMGDVVAIAANSTGFAQVKAADVRNTGDTKLTLDELTTSIQTTTVTQTVLKSWTLNSSRYYSIRAIVTVTDGTTNYGEWSVKGGYTNFSGTVTQRQKVILSEDQSNAGFAVDLVINGTAVELRVTGVAATTLRWQAHELIHEAIP